MVAPFNGTEYVIGDLDKLSPEDQEIISRLLEAGYPADHFGLSRLVCADQTISKEIAEGFAYSATQLVLWFIIDPSAIKNPDDHLVNTNDYAKALYQYAITGELPEG